LSELARRVHYSKSQLSRVENGERKPKPELARLCDAALGAGGELSALVPPPAAPRGPSRSTRSGEADQEPPAAADDGAGTLSSALCPVVLPEEDDAETARNVTHYAVHLAALRRLAQRMAPAPVLGQVSSAVDVLTVLARAAQTPAVRRQYLELLAFYCEFAGWMAQESGKRQEAERWIGRTEAAAREAQAYDLADHTYIRRAGLALYQGEAGRVTEYAVEAGRRGVGKPRILALAALREAQGRALEGRSDLCAAALDRAGELLEAATAPGAGSATAPGAGEGRRAEAATAPGAGEVRRAQAATAPGAGEARRAEAAAAPGAGEARRAEAATAPGAGESRRAEAAPGPDARVRPSVLVVGSQCTPSLGGLVGGWCLYDLGRPDEAAAMIEAGLQQLPAGATRLRALFTARLALGHAASGQLTAVVPVVDDLLKDAQGLCSHAVRSQLQLLTQLLCRRHARPGMRELHARVTAALRCAGCAATG
jgi:transcriptional regulator with XRE-family HTH domain